MAGVLSAILTAYRTALVTATFGNLPATFSDDDLPAGGDHRVFSLELAGITDQIGPGGVMGGGHQDFDAVVRLVLHWNPQLDEEAIYNTIADDHLLVAGVVLKASNRQSGQQTAFQPAGGWSETKKTTNAIEWTALYTVRFRETLSTI